VVAEVVAGGGEMGSAPGTSRVPRAALAAFLTCSLCKGYFREASAFAECGHTCEFYLLPRSRPPFLRFRLLSLLFRVLHRLVSLSPLSSQPRVAVASRCHPASVCLSVAACLVGV
jgi:hypothetical protein